MVDVNSFMNEKVMPYKNAIRVSITLIVIVLLIELIRGDALSGASGLVYVGFIVTLLLNFVSLGVSAYDMKSRLAIAEKAA